MQKESLTDLVSILANPEEQIQHGTAQVHGEPAPNALSARYLLDPLLLNKPTNLLLGTPRLASVMVSTACYFSKYSLRNSTVA